MTPELRIEIKNIFDEKKPAHQIITSMYSLLKKHGFTQQYIADESGLSKQTVSRLKDPITESGAPRMDSLIYMALALQFDKSLTVALINLFYPEAVTAFAEIERTSFR